MHSILRPRHDQDPDSASGEPLGGRVPEAGGRSTDDCDPTRNAETHDSPSNEYTGSMSTGMSSRPPSTVDMAGWTVPYLSTSRLAPS